MKSRILLTGTFCLACLSAPGRAAPLDSRVATFLQSQGLTLVQQVTVNGETGYLAEYRQLARPAVQPKRCLVLTGSPYAMGYQMAALRPADTYAMLTDFMKKVGLAQFAALGLDLEPGSPEAEALWQWAFGRVLAYCRTAEPVLAPYLREEFRGVADGVRAAGYTDVGYDDVMVLNQGLDGIFYLFAALLHQLPDASTADQAVASFRQVIAQIPALQDAVQFKGNRALFPKVKGDGATPLHFGCNEFVVSGKATLTGQTYHGRDFMFDTADIYQNAVCLMVRLPSQRRQRPFASVAPPGFVGQTTGINLDGVSMGQDISMGATFGHHIGFGSLLVVRHVLQNASTLRGAVTLVCGTPRGVPWKFIVADDTADPEYGAGAVLDAFASEPACDGPDCLPEWEQELLQPYSELLGDEDQPVGGVMVRGAKWTFPAQFEGIGRTLPVPNPFFPDLERWDIGIYFPPQIEASDDEVVAANHFIVPRARFSQFDPIVYTLYGPSGALADSCWRYEQMITDIAARFGRIDFFGPDPERPAEGSAGWIIDFLNTSRCDYYRDNVVHGHHAIMHNQGRTLRALFGYMDDPWVGVDLRAIVNFFETLKKAPPRKPAAR